MPSSASLVTPLFLHGSSSIKIILAALPFLQCTRALVNLCGNLCHKFGKIGPVIFSYFSASTKPLLYELAAITWTLLPPARVMVAV